MDVGSKDLVDGLLLVACVGLRMDCLHVVEFVLTVITEVQERTESETRSVWAVEKRGTKSNATDSLSQ